jgi:general secretion pathway protein D
MGDLCIVSVGVGNRIDPVPDRCRGIKRGLRHFVLASAVVLSACTTSQLQEYARLDGTSSGSNTGDNSARPQQPRSAWNSLIAPATNKPAGSEFVSRGSGQFMASGDAVVPAKTFKGTDGVTINLLNAPVAQAAKTILGDILKADYVISDKVSGTVTIQTSAPVEPEAVADIFEAVLKSNGIALVRAEGHYRLSPLASAATAPVSIGGARGGPGITTRIVPLKYVAASEMRRVIEPMFGQGAILRADDQRNLLVVNGTGSELANLESLVAIFDVDWMRQMSFGVFPVKTAEPEVIAKELETVFGLDKDGPLKGVMRIVPNPRLNSVLVISSKPEYLDTARSWIERYLAMGEDKEEQIYAYKVQNRPAAELADILHKILATDATGPGGGSVAPRLEPTTTTSAFSSQTGTGLGATSATGLGTGLSSAGLGTSTGGAFRSSMSSSPSTTPTTSSAASYRTPTAKVVVDDTMHTLVIQTVPSEYKRIERILRRLDVAGTQIMIEVSVLEVDLTDELRFGVQWFFQKGNHSFTFSNAAAGAVASTFPGFSYFLSASNINVAIDALSNITKVNVISTPNITVMDNKTAMLQVGDQVPIQTGTSTSTVANSAVLTTIQMVDTGVILSVTPHVNDGGRVQLDIEQEVSSATPTTSSTIQSPTIQQRRVRTSVAIGDGETVALGGLIQERDNVTRNSMPILGDIPTLGNAFGTKDDQVTRTELLIIIRPHVVRDSEDARRATDEYRTRIKAETPRSQMGRNKIQRDLNRAQN